MAQQCLINAEYKKTGIGRYGIALTILHITKYKLISKIKPKTPISSHSSADKNNMIVW